MSISMLRPSTHVQGKGKPSVSILTSDCTHFATPENGVLLNQALSKQGFLHEDPSESVSSEADFEGLDDLQIRNARLFTSRANVESLSRAKVVW